MSKKLRVFLLAFLVMSMAVSSAVSAYALNFTFNTDKTVWTDPANWNVTDANEETMTAAEYYDKYATSGGNEENDGSIDSDIVVKANFYPGGFSSAAIVGGDDAGVVNAIIPLDKKNLPNLEVKSNVNYTITSLTFEGKAVDNGAYGVRTATINFGNNIFALPVNVYLTNAASAVFNNARRIAIAEREADAENAPEAYIIGLATGVDGGTAEGAESSLTINSPLYFGEYFTPTDVDVDPLSLAITNNGAGTLTLNGAVSNFDSGAGFPAEAEEGTPRVTIKGGNVVLGDVSLLRGSVEYSGIEDEAGLSGKLTLPAGSLTTNDLGTIKLADGATVALAGELTVNAALSSPFITLVAGENDTNTLKISGGKLNLHRHKDTTAEIDLIQVPSGSTLSLVDGAKLVFAGIDRTTSADTRFVLGDDDDTDNDEETIFTIRADSSSSFDIGFDTVAANLTLNVQKNAGLGNVVRSNPASGDLKLVVDGSLVINGNQAYLAGLDGVGTISVDSGLMTLTGAEDDENTDYTGFAGKFLAGDVWLNDEKTWANTAEEKTNEDENKIVNYPFSEAEEVAIDNLIVTGSLTLKKTPAGVENIWLRRAYNGTVAAKSADMAVGDLIISADNLVNKEVSVDGYVQVKDPVVIASIKIDGTTSKDHQAVIDVTGSKVIVNEVSYYYDTVGSNDKYQGQRVLFVTADALTEIDADENEVTLDDVGGRLTVISGKGGNIGDFGENNGVRNDSIIVDGKAELVVQSGSSIGQNNVSVNNTATNNVASGAYLNVENGVVFPGTLTFKENTTLITSVNENNRGLNSTNYAVKVTGPMTADDGKLFLNVILEDDMPNANPRNWAYSVIGSDNTDTSLGGTYDDYVPFKFEATSNGLGVVAKLLKEYVYPAIGTPYFADDEENDVTEQWREAGKFRIEIPIKSITRNMSGTVDYTRYLTINDAENAPYTTKLVTDGSDTNTYRVIRSGLLPVGTTASKDKVVLWGDVLGDFTEAFDNGFDLTFTLEWDLSAFDQYEYNEDGTGDYTTDDDGNYILAEEPGTGDYNKLDAVVNSAAGLKQSDFLDRTWTIRVPKDVDGADAIRKVLHGEDEVASVDITPVAAYVDVKTADSVEFTVDGMTNGTATDTAKALADPVLENGVYVYKDKYTPATTAKILNDKGEYIDVYDINVMLKGNVDKAIDDFALNFAGTTATFGVSIDKLGYNGGVNEAKELYVKATVSDTHASMATSATTIWLVSSDLKPETPFENATENEATVDSTGKVTYAGAVVEPPVGETFNTSTISFVKHPEWLVVDEANTDESHITFKVSGDVAAAEDSTEEVAFSVMLSNGKLQPYTWVINVKAAAASTSDDVKIEVPAGALYVRNVVSGEEYSIELTAVSADSWSSSDVPAWISVVISGEKATVSGTPGASEVRATPYEFTVVALNGTASDEVKFALTVIASNDLPPAPGPGGNSGDVPPTPGGESGDVPPAPGIGITGITGTKSATANATTGAFTFTLGTSGTPAGTVVWTATGTGDNVNGIVNITSTANGVITGTVDPTLIEAYYTITVVASDDVNRVTDELSLTYTPENVTPTPSGDVTPTYTLTGFTSSNDVAVFAGARFSIPVTITGTAPTPAWTATVSGDAFTVTPTSGSGKSFTLTGTAPTAAGTYQITLRATYSNLTPITKTVDLVVTSRRVGGGSGGGCDAGFGALALLLATPLFLRKRK